MALEGSERKILHAILHEQGGALAGYVDGLETLEGKECVQWSLGVDGVSAYITAKGRQELRRSPVISGEERAESPLKIVLKGLRSFGAEDKDFFLQLLPDPRSGDGLGRLSSAWCGAVSSLGAAIAQSCYV